MRLTSGTIDCLDPQRTLVLILRSKHHVVALTNHVEEVPPTLYPCTQTYNENKIFNDE